VLFITVTFCGEAFFNLDNACNADLVVFICIDQLVKVSDMNNTVIC
jgi:hypothetical protein